MTTQLAFFLSITLTTVDAGRPQSVTIPLLNLLPLVQFAAPIVQRYSALADKIATYATLGRIALDATSFGLGVAK